VPALDGGNASISAFSRRTARWDGDDAAVAEVVFAVLLGVVRVNVRLTALRRLTHDWHGALADHFVLGQ